MTAAMTSRACLGLVFFVCRDLVAERTRLHNRLRWHLHELDLSLHAPSRGLRRYCVLDQPADTLNAFDGIVARLARELVERARQLAQQINSLEGRAAPAGARVCTGAGRDPGMRHPGRGNDRRRDGRRARGTR